MFQVIEFLVGFIADFIDVMNFEIIKYNGISITWLNILLTTMIIPVIFGLFKSSLSEMNSKGDYSLVNDIKGISHKHFSNRSKTASKGGE